MCENSTLVEKLEKAEDRLDAAGQTLVNAPVTRIMSDCGEFEKLAPTVEEVANIEQLRAAYEQAVVELRACLRAIRQSAEREEDD